MPLDLAYAKQHWKVLAGGLVGVLLLVYLLRHASASSAPASASSDSTDLSGSSQVQALNTAADLTNAQTNAQVETTEIQGQVASNQIAAQLQATEVTTAAQLDATNRQTDAGVTDNTTNDQTAIALQQITTQAQIQQTQIEGNTLDTLGAEAGQTAVQVQQAKNQVGLAEVSSVNSQLTYAATHDTGHEGSYLQDFAPVALALTGQGSAAASAENAVQSTAQKNTASSVITATSSGVGSILSGLFS